MFKLFTIYNDTIAKCYIEKESRNYQLKEEIAFLSIINNRITRNIPEFHNSTFIKDEWIYKITRKPILIKS